MTAELVSYDLEYVELSLKKFGLSIVTEQSCKHFEHLYSIL